jgi:7-cyano-7-deazaguanine synthase
MVANKETHVLMFSGGLDSYLALLTLLDNGITPKLVYSAHGSKNHYEQLGQARMLGRKHGLEVIVDESLNLGSWERESAFIPNRNGFLAFVGSLYGDRIWFAIMDGEQTYDDCKQETFLALSLSLTKLSGRPVTVDSPFWELTKAEVINKLDPIYLQYLTDTYSCHNGTVRHCGYCTACFRRFVAFELNNLSDVWEVHPSRTGTAETYYLKASKGNYGKRDKEILDALQKVGYKHD